MIVQVKEKDGFKYGVKRTCRSCGINFYDLDRHPSECPNCGAIYELHVTTRTQKHVVTEKADFFEEMPFNLEGVEEDSIESNIELVEDDPFSDVMKEDDDS